MSVAGSGRSMRAVFAERELAGCVSDALAIILSPVPSRVNTMPPNPEAARAQALARIAEIRVTLTAMKYLSSGTLLKRTKVCGNPRCHCATDPAARHGPYFEWSYLKGRKLRHRTLSPEQAELMRLAIANHRKVKKLLKTWEAQTLRLIELSAPD
jgi:hypothetical protein